MNYIEKLKASSEIMQDMWNRYQRKYDYAEGITWNMLMGTVEEIL